MRRSPPARESVVIALLLAGLATPAAGGPAPCAGAGSAVDVETLLSEARRVQEADLASWAGYRFRRLAARVKLDADGNVSRITDAESIVTPLGGPKAAGGAPRFDETLVRIDGAPPTRAQVEAYREDAPFTRHYANTVSADGAEEQEGYSLAFLLRMSSYRYDGMEPVEGRRCHRVRFQADPDAPGDNLPARFARALSGTLWITEEGAHIARASVHSVAPIDITLAIVRLSTLEIELMGQPLESGSWVPRTIETRATVRILGIPIRRLTRYSYSEFVPVPAAVPAETMGR